jgi:hypothetical protein
MILAITADEFRPFWINANGLAFFDLPPRDPDDSDTDDDDEEEEEEDEEPPVVREPDDED